jgi:hypothetical protein
MPDTRLQSPQLNFSGRGKTDTAFLLLLGIFLVIYLIVWASSQTDMRVIMDGIKYNRLALAILDHGWPTKPGDPTGLEARIQPAYSYLIAFLHIIGIEKGNGAGVALVQGAMLLASGLLIRQLIQVYYPRAQNIAFALVVLNPSALFFAQSTLLDTFFALLYTVGFYHFVQYSRQSRMYTAIIIGAVSGLCLLVRQEMAYLIWVLPIILPLLSASGAYGHSWRKSTLHGIFAMTCAIVIGLPWAVALHSSGYGYSFTSGEGAEAHFREAVATLEQYKKQTITLDEAREFPMQAKRNFISARGEAWKSLPATSRSKKIADLYVRIILSYDTLVIAKAFTNYTVGFFVSGGAQHAGRILGLERLWGDTFFHSTNSLDFVRKAFQQADPVAVSITLLFVTFAFVMRILGLIGIGILIANRNWGLLLACIGAIIFSLATHFFIGIARYRLPVDPVLLVLAGIAISGMAGWWRNRNRIPEKPPSSLAT